MNGDVSSGQPGSRGSGHRGSTHTEPAGGLLPVEDAGYRLLFEHMDSMVCTLDLEGRFTSVNRAGELLTGRSRSELEGLLAIELIATHLRERAVDQFARRLATRDDLPADESVLVKPDGTRVPIEITSRLLEEDGRAVGVLGLVRDLTGLKSAEHALEQSEERFRSAFDHAAIGMALVALDGRFQQVNGSLCALVGYTSDELLAKSFQDITHPDDLGADLEFVRQMLAGALRTYQMEKRYFHRDGREVWILLSVSLVRAADGSPLYFISQIQDIDVRKRAEERMAQSQAELAEAQRLAHLGNWEGDLGTQRITGSAELYRIFGMDPASEPLTFQEFLALVVPEDREAVAAVRARAVETGETFLDEYRIARADGQLRWIQSRGTAVRVDGEPGRIVGTAQDVTEQKLVAERLRGAESRFRSFFANAPIGQAIYSPDGQSLEVNPAFTELLGYTVDDLTGLTWQDITHPDDVETDANLTKRMLEGEFASFQLEKRYLHRDGSVVWALLTLTLARDDAGEPMFGIAQVLDISARKRAEEAVTRSERRLAEAQQIAHLGSWEWDVAEDSVTWSDELYRLFGVDPAAGVLTYDRYLGTVHPDDRASVDAVVRRAFETGEPFSVEHRVVLADGIARWIHGQGEVEQRNGATVAMRGTAQDITERKSAEEKLRDAEERYRTLIEQLPLATYIRPLDMADSNLYVSPQVEQLLGYAAEEWLTNPDLPATIIHPDDWDRVRAAGEHVRRTGEHSHIEYRYVTADGGTVWVLDETYVVRDERDEPHSVQGYIVDITERKRAEEERDRLRDELHHAQKLEALGRLAGGIAHDFNNTLTAINGYSELLLDILDHGGSPRREAEQIRRAAEQASALPRQLLAFSRKQVLQPGLLDLDTVVGSASALLEQLVGEAITVTTTAGAASVHVRADASQVEQILLNLVVNARDAMPAGGTIAIETRVQAVDSEQAAESEVEPGDYVVLSVSDTGQGMDPDTKARAFEPFFTTKAPGEGSGLGLATAYGTVRQSGGFMRAESVVGRGSTFEIFLPCTPSGPVDEAETSLQPDVPPTAATVLLVEDEELVRDVSITALERAGYRVLGAASASAALEAWNDNVVDVLVTDMVMPRMSGRELADRILHLAPSTPVVFMSGYTDEAPVVELNGTAPSFLQKPFSPSTLVAAVRAALDKEVEVHANGNGTPEGGRISCLVADDHPAVLDSVSRFLELRGFSVVARVSRGDDALDAMVKLAPTVALLDVGMSPLSGLDVAERAASEAPETHIVVYTGSSDHQLLERALDVGARGFVLKDAPLSELERALRIVADGGTYVAPELASALVSAGSESERSPLTPREREVLALLADGRTNESASRALGISAETVQSHVRNVMGKLEADTRTQAVATAIRQSLID